MQVTPDKQKLFEKSTAFIRSLLINIWIYRLGITYFSSKYLSLQPYKLGEFGIVDNGIF